MPQGKTIKRWARTMAAVLLFLLLFLLFWRTASYTLRPNDENVRTRLEGFYAEEAGSLDVVFVGSSAIYSFFSPLRLWHETGISSYLYATPNQTIPMIRYILEECRKTQPDALFLIELRPMLASEEDKQAIRADLRRLTDNMPYSLTRSRLIGELAEPSERLSYELDLIKYHENWKNWQDFDLTFTWGKKDPMKGWNFVSAYEPLLLENRKHVNGRISAGGENEADLRELLSWCKDQSVRAVFLTTPFALSRRQAKIYNSVGDIVEEYGYPFWNYCRKIDEIGLDAGTDYYDFRHTNTLGAVKCTNYLGKDILEWFEENGWKPSEKTEVCRSDWERCWQSYQRFEAESAALIRWKIQNGEAGQ